MAEDINDKEDSFLDNKEDDPEPVGNPAPPSDVDLDLLRGDRIGDTVYSGKWCIQTVMKMLKSNVIIKAEESDGQMEDGKLEVVDMEEELQNEVGVLWDMTSNVEVCQYLQSVGAIESIYHVIANSRCPRATEMCVGMLGNIITHEELWQSLQSDTTLFAILIPLFSSSDQPVLLELSRFFTTAMSHSQMGECYSTMCSNGSLVTQELVRILSGSTNCDLLKQTTELTHILMCVDNDDTHFNALFADPDFITAVLEASKEIGYQQETASQSSIMEILHGFTTYPAGITAMETCMGSITEAITKYLRSLCSNINLSNSSDTINIIITLLNHIFCRSLEVRIEVMSSSKLLQNILKILIALYRRLGLYDSIANTPHDGHDSKRHHRHHNQHRHHHHNHQHNQHRHHHHHHQHKKQSSMEESDTKLTSVTASESWEGSTNVEEEEEEKSLSRGNKSEPKSWSERAGQGETTPKHVFATPEPSPKHQSHSVMKEMEFLSWSERRVASPLVDGADAALVSESGAVDVWKIPQETRKLKKKTLSMDKDTVVPLTSSSSSLMDQQEVGHFGERHLADGMRSRVKMDEERETTSSCLSQEVNEESVHKKDMPNDDQTPKPELSSISAVTEDFEAKGIDADMARHSTDSNKSGGFSPSMGDSEEEEEDGDESMECENPTHGKGDKFESTVADSKVADLNHQTDGISQMGLSVKDHENGDDKKLSESNNEGTDDGDNDGGFGDEDKKDGGNNEERAAVASDDWGGDGSRRARCQSFSKLDKYNTLLNMVREFLSDFFNNFREGLLTEQGVPVVSNIVSFLDTQCRRSTLRIMIHCVGPSQDITTPVGRLIHLSSCMKAINLNSVLVECLRNKERDSGSDSKEENKFK